MKLFGKLFGGRAPKTTMRVGDGIIASGYEGSRLGRRLAGWRADRRHVNALLASGGETLRARARQMCRENPYAANAVEAFVAATVGAGIKPASQITDPERRRAVQQAFLDWTDQADADGLTDFYGLQALAARAAFEAGECFIRFRPRRAEDGLVVPLQLQLIESEQLPLNHNEDLGAGRRIVQGVEFDAIGRRVAYHFLRRHPGDIKGIADPFEKTIVPASEVMHLYRPLRPGQVRGQPEITPGLVRLYLLDSYDDAELERKRVAALFSVFVTTPAPEDGPSSLVPGGHDPAAGDDVLLPLEPGLIQGLKPGEDVKVAAPAEVGGSYEAFQYRSLLAIAASVGLPYSSVTSDVSKANYSSLRAAQVELRRRVDQFQHMTLVFQLCRPVWLRWLEAAVFAGAVPIRPSEFLRQRQALTRARWIPPRWEWVDPLKDRTAELLAVRSGAKALPDMIEAEGYDADETLERIATFNKRLDELGLTLDSDPRRMSRAGATVGAGLAEPEPASAGERDSPEGEGGEAAVEQDANAA